METSSTTIFGQFTGKSRKQKGQVLYYFTTSIDGKTTDIRITGEVLDKTPIIQRMSIVGISGTWSETKKDIFHVNTINDMPERANLDDLNIVGQHLGIQLLKEEYCRCLDTLQVDNFYEAVDKLLYPEQRINFLNQVGLETGNKFFSLTSFFRNESELGNILKVFYETNCGLDMSHAIQVMYEFRQRASFAHTKVEYLIKNYPWILKQVLDNQAAAGEAAQKIADHYKLDTDKCRKMKIASDIISYLQEQMRRGDCFAWHTNVYGRMLSKGYKYDEINSAIAFLTSESKIARHFGCIVPEITYSEKVALDTGRYPKKLEPDKLKKLKSFYLPGIYFSEKEAAENLADIIMSPCNDTWDEEQILSYTETNLDSEQRSFIQAVCKNRIVILTGEAGTGKSRALKNLITGYYNVFNKVPAILAPTALAAYQAAQGTVGEEYAQTIHAYSYLYMEDSDLIVDIHKMVAMTDERLFSENSSELVIIEEAGMLGPMMLSKLLRTIPVNARLVFCGDPYQLPPVGAGGVFPTLIELADKDKLFPHIELKQNYRNKDDVITAARAVRRGCPLTENDSVKITICSAKNIPAKCLEAKEELQPENVDPNNTLILAPTLTKGVGVETLNDTIQKRYAEALKPIPGSFLMVGQPIVATRNDRKDIFGIIPKTMRAIRPDREDVYNGMKGIIDSYDPETGLVTVKYFFTNKELLRNYKPEELDYYLTRCYAMTPHKAQGGEAKNIILAMTSSFANRNLIYTAITRCKRGKVRIIALPEFNEAKYAEENWEELILKDEQPPTAKVLTKLRYRVKNKIGSERNVLVIK